ncbi:hypothetical protein F511_36877 [Dorcoceras hygrometricum]|uniref:Uncharacterized protein n=1 Tax=Dorcoceras hygrometricum TaxID=472368 RepID=A0A2Z7A4G3_9LAMI|nr:hypothetical protein F511_36877 [Dorcoceras hygrometricum]
MTTNLMIHINTWETNRHDLSSSTSSTNPPSCCKITWVIYDTSSRNRDHISQKSLLTPTHISRLSNKCLPEKGSRTMGRL